MSSLTPLQMTIIERAKWLLEDRGVYEICIDHIKKLSDEEIKRDEQAAVLDLVDDTLYWRMGMGG